MSTSRFLSPGICLEKLLQRSDLSVQTSNLGKFGVPCCGLETDKSHICFSKNVLNKGYPSFDRFSTFLASCKNKDGSVTDDEYGNAFLSQVQEDNSGSITFSFEERVPSTTANPDVVTFLQHHEKNHDDLVPEQISQIIGAPLPSSVPSARVSSPSPPPARIPTATPAPVPAHSTEKDPLSMTSMEEMGGSSELESVSSPDSNDASKVMGSMKESESMLANDLNVQDQNPNQKLQLEGEKEENDMKSKKHEEEEGLNEENLKIVDEIVKEDKFEEQKDSIGATLMADQVEVSTVSQSEHSEQKTNEGDLKYSINENNHSNSIPGESSESSMASFPSSATPSPSPSSVATSATVCHSIHSMNYRIMPNRLQLHSEALELAFDMRKDMNLNSHPKPFPLSVSIQNEDYKTLQSEESNTSTSQQSKTETSQLDEVETGQSDFNKQLTQVLNTVDLVKYVMVGVGFYQFSNAWMSFAPQMTFIQKLYSLLPGMVLFWVGYMAGNWQLFMKNLPRKLAEVELSDFLSRWKRQAAVIVITLIALNFLSGGFII